MPKGKGKKAIQKNKKPTKNRPKVNIPDSYSIDSNMQTPDPEYMAFRRDQEVVDDSGDGKYNSFDTSDLYIPMKIFSLENFLDIAEKIKSTSYGVVQEDPIFQKSISEEELVANVFNTDHKMVLLAEAGNGKTLFARRILKIQQEKYPDTFTFFIHLKTFAKKKECSLGEILLPAEFQGNAPGNVHRRANALKIISDSPDECLFIIDSLEDFDERRKVIEALVTGNVCGDESNTGMVKQRFY
ncbi:Oidioi.mRNA.OKI2018_I69.XSR.g14620.t2.cds [Oikopleura dioica]|uniref:Oidioi.mRNA.OKI2018_I69.XSR.g14620.t2.cds n=1 Tax=Oikopleura dioica TaxID=34765 RepID=A0ABN7SGN8_OIKDI|nr:Oidioi.mRNA.OKI2018_I69.XSR.g14620.t2.cds [Oikopleura dioica]